MTQATNTVALNAGWTDAVPTLTNASNTLAFSNSNCGYIWGNYWYPYYQPLVVEHRDTRPIRLTMSEVERLRVAAKKDKDLKATLEKFTEHIEVVVDFGGK